MKSLLGAGGLLLYILAALFSCTSPSSAKTYTVHYRWQYNCVANQKPVAFEYGTSPDGIALNTIGTISVTSCTGAAQAFQIATPKQRTAPTTGTRFYVRAMYAGNTFSPPDFYTYL